MYKKTVSKKKHCFISYEEKKAKSTVLIENFNAFMQDQTSWKKTFLPLLFTSFQYRKILKRHLKDYVKTYDKQKIKMSKKVNELNLKILKEK